MVVVSPKSLQFQTGQKPARPHRRPQSSPSRAVVVNRYGGNERIIDDEGSNIIKFGVGITPDDVSVQWLGTSGAAESGLKIRIGIGAGNV